MENRAMSEAKLNRSGVMSVREYAKGRDKDKRAMNEISLPAGFRA
jgi:hypothetical protein